MYTILSILNTILSLLNTLSIEYCSLSLLNTILSVYWTPQQIWQCKGMRHFCLNQSFTGVLWGRNSFFCPYWLRTAHNSTITSYHSIPKCFFQHISSIGSVFIVFSASQLSNHGFGPEHHISHTRTSIILYMSREWKNHKVNIGKLVQSRSCIHWAELVRVYYSPQQEQQLLSNIMPSLQSPKWNILRSISHKHLRIWNHSSIFFHVTLL